METALLIILTSLYAMFGCGVITLIQIVEKDSDVEVWKPLALLWPLILLFACFGMWDKKKNIG